MITDPLMLYTCTDHDCVSPTGVASVVIARNLRQARSRLDTQLKKRGLKPYAEHRYTLTEHTISPKAMVLRDGDY